MTDPWVCLDCGARHAASGGCRACGRPNTCDARDTQVRARMREVERGLAERRTRTYGLIGAICGMALIVGLWTVPGYWHARGRSYPGLPLLFDQWIAMAAV